MTTGKSGDTREPDVVSVPRPAGGTPVSELTERLLREDPAERRQAVEAVSAAIAEASASGERERSIAPGAPDSGRRSLAEPEFVGRTEEIHAIERRCDGVRGGGGGVVLLEAESGGGKTRLLEEVEACVERHGAWALSGQGRDQVAARPYQLLEGVVAEVVARASADSGFAARLERRLAGYEDALVAAMPKLGEVFDTRAPAVPGDEEHGERRSMRALARMLDALGTPERPAVLLLDDCQWSDELTVRLLRHWAAAPGRRSALVVATFRSEEVPAGHPLRGVAAIERLSLAPLAAADVRRLAESMAGPLPGDAVALVERLAEGSPFMAVEVLRGLVETGALVPDESGWRAVPEAMADVQSSQRAAAVLARRLARIPSAVLEVLEAGAVLGKQFDLELTAALTGQSATEVVTAVSEAERRHVVWVEPEKATASFVHDKLREALLARLGEVDLRAMHRAAAERIELAEGERSFELAYHFDAAGDAERALPYALRAAAEARGRHALEIAALQYEIAAGGARTAAPDVRLRVAEGAGEVAMLRGLYDDAERELRAARELARERMSAARLDGKLGELAFKRGDMATASPLLEQSLRELGEPVPRGRVGVVVRLLREVAVQVAHSVAPRLFLARRDLGSPSQERLLLRIRLYSRLAHAYWFQRGMVPCAWAHLREMNLAERHPPTSELGMAYSEHAPVMTMIPWYRRGIAYGRRSLETYRRLGDRWGEGHALAYYGIVLYAAARWEDALERFRSAVRILERTGDQWEVNVASWHIALCLYRLGRLGEAVEIARRVHGAALEIGDRQASGIALGIWAKASSGAVPRELLDAELQNPSDDIHTRAEVLQADALGHLAASNPKGAVRTLERAEELVRDAGLRQEYVAPVLPWLATALRARLDAMPPLAAGPRRRRLREARRVARRACRVAGSYPNNLPHALRERAMLAAMAGRPGRARRLLDRSLAVAKRQGAGQEAALTLSARAQVGTALGWPEAEAESAAAAKQPAKLRSAGAQAPPEQAEPTAERSLAEEMLLTLSLLEATLDSTADGILVVNRAGKIVRFNRRFVEMWRLPDEVLASRDDKRAIEFVLDQLVDPDEFVAKIEELYGNPEAESHDELNFKDGRVFERYSKPQVSGEEIIGRVWSFRDVTQRKRHEVRLRHLADHDPLTGMFNRRRFEEEVERACAYAGRYTGEALALLLVDLDNFKYVNDTLGHRAGDEVVKSIAAVLRGRIRATDVPARLGGDEFAVILPRVGEEGAKRVAADLLEAIRAHRVMAGGRQVSVTGSIGIAVAGERADPDQLLVDADLAMYAAKEAGKDRASLHTPESALRARERVHLSWVERLRRALDEDLFELHCQPIVEIAAGRVSQFELLLRLADRGQLVAPAAFLPSAERLGLAQAIDRWVIERAIALSAEAAAGGRRLRLEVNLSAKSIEDETLPDLIGAQIAAAGIEPSDLIFEITETAAIANMETAAAFADKLSRLGCRFALDDFGAGFGSFLYLKHLPVSYLKIDGDFIADLLDDPMDQNVVQAIVGIARNMGKQTIAEFVGDERTLRRLREYGVDYAQGYHVGRPRPVAEAPLETAR